MPDKRFLSPIEVARMLGVRDAKVFAWIRTGEINAVDLSQGSGKRPRYRIKPEAVEAFIQRRTVSTAAPKLRKASPKKLTAAKSFY